MANATSNRPATVQFGQPTAPPRQLGVSGSVHIYAGTMLSTNPNDAIGNVGWVGPLVATSSATVVGVAGQEVDSTLLTSNSTTVLVLKGVFAMSNSSGGDAITQNNVDLNCYAVDDHTVAGSSSAGRPVAGTVYGVPNAQTVYVWFK